MLKTLIELLKTRIQGFCLLPQPLESANPRTLHIPLLLLFIIPVLISPNTSLATEERDTIVISAEEIEAMQALKIADILNNVPGVKAGSSSVSIHGSYKVKVFVDGRPINDPTSSHGGVNWEMVSPEDVEKIEVLRGKGGLVYGQDAAGGVILITTHTTRNFSGNVKAYGGNHDSRNITASISTTHGKLNTGLSGGYESTDGYKINNDKERYRAGIKLGYTPEGKSPVTFSVDHLQDKRGSSGLPDYPTPFSRKETRNTVYALQATVLNLGSSTHYNDGYRHNTDSSRGLDRTLRVHKFGQDVTGTFTPTENGPISGGLALTWDRANGTGFEDQEEYSISVFASRPFSWPRYNLTLTAGLRGNYHSNFSNTVNPEAELVFKKTAWRLTAAYSRSDNLPSFYKRYNETSSTRPNPDLDMETADNLSLSFSTTPIPSLSVSMSIFHNRLTNRITYLTAEDGVGEYHNFGDVLYAGGDTAVGWQLNTAWKVKVSYTYLDAEDRETGLRLPGKARHIAHMDLYWQPSQTLSLVASTMYTSKVFRNKSNTRTVPAYTTADLRVEQSFDRFSLFGEVKNLLDKTYYYADGLLAAPRTWVIGVNLRL